MRAAPIVCPEESHPACSNRQQLCRRNSPLMGIDAPTPARIGTGRPMGRSHFSFGGERKVCKRKPAARRLREKALYCPFLKEGVRNVARSTVELPTWTFVRARAHSDPLSKRARLFPSAAYRRSAPPQSAAGRLTPCGLGWIHEGWPILEGQRPAGLGKASHGACRNPCPRSWRGAGLPLAGILLPSQQTVGGLTPCGLGDHLLLGRFWKFIGQRVWGCEP